jgi:hypothetical protein
VAAVVQHSSGAGGLLLVAFALAAVRWGTWRTCRRTLELVAILGAALVALIVIVQRREGQTSPVRRPRFDRPDDDDLAFERWQRERWREASARTSVEGFGKGFGGKG